MTYSYFQVTYFFQATSYDIVLYSMYVTYAIHSHRIFSIGAELTALYYLLLMLKSELLPNTASQKQELILLITQIVDIFVKCNSYVGIKNLTCHEIETGNMRTLIQPVRCLPYASIRTAINF